MEKLSLDKFICQIQLPSISDKSITWFAGLERDPLCLHVGLATELMSALPEISLVVWVCHLSEIMLSRGHWATTARLTQERLVFLLLWSLHLGERAVKTGLDSAAGCCMSISVLLTWLHTVCKTFRRRLMYFTLFFPLHPNGKPCVKKGYFSPQLSQILFLPETFIWTLT